MMDTYHSYYQPKFVILGFIKCGQNSMAEYLRRRYNLPLIDEEGNRVIKRREIACRKDAIEEFVRDFDNYTPVFITRNPVQRIWSAYHYLGYNTRMSFEEYLELDEYNEIHGNMNPIRQSDYNRWIKPFNRYYPIVVELEEMCKNPNFPRLNITSPETGYGEIPERYKRLIETKILNNSIPM